MRSILTAVALSQLAINLLNVRPIKKVRHVVGDFITPYPDVTAMKKESEIINKSLDLNDMLISTKISKLENKINKLAVSIDELQLRVCDLIVAEHNRLEKEVDYEKSNDMDS
jgi:hypothetical protein